MYSYKQNNNFRHSRILFLSNCFCQDNTSKRCCFWGKHSNKSTKHHTVKTTGCPQKKKTKKKNVDHFRKFCCFLIFRVCQWNFPHLLPLDTFNGDIYLILSFLICAEFLPLVLKIFVSSFFKIFNISSIITCSKKFYDSNYVALNRTNSNFLKDCRGLY